MRVLPNEVDPSVHGMLTEDPGDITWSNIGGLNDQIREIREVCGAVLVVGQDIDRGDACLYFVFAIIVKARNVG